MVADNYVSIKGLSKPRDGLNVVTIELEHYNYLLLEKVDVARQLNDALNREWLLEENYKELESRNNELESQVRTLRNLVGALNSQIEEKTKIIEKFERKEKKRKNERKLTGTNPENRE